MGDPDLLGRKIAQGGGQLRPVDVVADHQRQFDAALPGAGAHIHPARGIGKDRIAEPLHPWRSKGRRRGKHQLRRSGIAGRDQRAKVDPLFGMVIAQPLQRAMDGDGRIVPRRPRQRDHPLRLAERIGAHQMRAAGELGHAGQQPPGLHHRSGMAEDRQAEGRLGDENIAGHRLPRQADRVRRAAIVARDQNARTVVRHDQDLRRAEDMAGRMKADRDRSDAQRPLGGLTAPGEILAIAQRHDLQRLARRHHRAMAGAGVVGMAMGHQRARHGAEGVDVEIPHGAVKPGLGRIDDLLRPQRHARSRSPASRTQ